MVSLHTRLTTEALDLLSNWPRDTAREIAACFYFDPEWRLLGARHTIGGRTHIAVPIAHVVRDALGFEATRMILVHYHPSGDPRPSAADLAYTRLLARTLEAVGVVLHDHLVIADGVRFSLREAGML